MSSSFPLPVFSGDAPLYDQLYRHIRSAIQSGELPPGEKLPSKRQQCITLGISMSTVEASYSLLVAEGYLLAHPRSGYTVAQVIPMEGSAPVYTVPEEPAFSASPWKYSFSTDAVDTSVFPFSSWARISKEAVYRNPDLLQRGHPQGDFSFRTSLAGFLSQYRGVKCHPDQIVVGAGVDYLFSTLLQALPEHTKIAVEDPGYPAVYSTVRRQGRTAIPIPVDPEGMDPTALTDSAATIAYVTPSHQFPLGVTMPAGRRSRLLQWVSGQDRYLIEDDYDSEFRYSSRPIPAMQGMDRNGRVIYMGTFSRSLAPSIRVAYMILPPALLKRYQNEFSQTACTVSRFEQESLRQFMEQGLYTRHLRRAVNLYRKKNELLTDALNGIPGAVLSGQHAGLHFLLTVPAHPEKELISLASEAGVRISPLSQYCHMVSPIPSTAVLGYAGLTEEDLLHGAALLREAFR